jgi:hypothetical protein
MRARIATTVALSLVLGTACSIDARAAADASSSCPPPPRLLGVQQVTSGTRVGGDSFGGISGMDYDATRRRWWLLSDDRGDLAPARFFEARLRLGRGGFQGVDLLSSRRLSAPTLAVGQPTPMTPPAGRERIDGEALRLVPSGGELLVASEGDPALGIGHGVRRHLLDGSLAGELALPPPLRLAPASPAVTGPLANRSIEGLAFAPGSGALWVALEAPLLQDGPVADADRGADLRLTRIEAPDGPGEDFVQFVYRADAAMAHGAGESSDNGISEILAIDADTLLVLERSGRQDRTGKFTFRTRLYCAEVADATDVAALQTLRGVHWRPMRKQLLLEFPRLPDGAGNYEAMAWGPSRGPRSRTLVVASDNNFFPAVPTVFLAFELRAAAR